MWIEYFHQIVDGVAVLLLIYFIGIPLLSNLCDLLAKAWRRITGSTEPEKETDEQKKLLEESKAFMTGDRK